MGRIRSVALVCALLLSLIVGIGLVLAGSGVLPVSSIRDVLGDIATPIVAVAVGGGLLVVGAHYAIQLSDERCNATMFHHEYPGGRIDVCPAAIRELIGGILASEIGLTRFRIQLRHDGQGVQITVRTTLTPDQRVTEVAERIQQDLSRHVADRTGVEVTSVTILVQGIREASSEDVGVNADAD